MKTISNYSGNTVIGIILTSVSCFVVSIHIFQQKNNFKPNFDFKLTNTLINPTSCCYLINFYIHL